MAYLKSHGSQMPAAVATHALEQMFVLQSLYFEDSDASSIARPEIHSSDYWQSLCPYDSSDPVVLCAALAEARILQATADSELLSSLVGDGFAVVAPSRDAAPRVAELCVAMSRIISRLRLAGLPPQFIFVFNAPWQLLDEHWGGPASAALGNDCVMEADMNCWALRRKVGISTVLGASADSPVSGTSSITIAPDETHVGSSFSLSHRDQRYDSCHTETGVPTSMNLWTPFNDGGARTENGAMRVIPIEADALFFCPDHPMHLETRGVRSSSSSSSGVADQGAHVVLECDAGAACCWTPALIHWGGECAASSVIEPRASIAVTFRSAAAPRSEFGGSTVGGEAAPPNGPPPLLRAQLCEQLTLTRRLAYVAKALLSYSHWHPGFPGVQLAK
jgi:hypothetical protein